MSAYKLGQKRLRFVVGVVILLTYVIIPVYFLQLQVGATGLNSRSLTLLNSAPSATTDYTLSFTLANTSTIGSLSILFCSNDSLQYDTCTLPEGMDVTNAQLSYQNGISDFSYFVAATNSIVLSRTPSVITAPVTVTLTFHNVLNPSSAGPYYARVGAYSSDDATGSPVAFGGLGFAITNNIQISSVVPPYITFCSGIVINTLSCSSANGDYINFGELSYSHSSQADSQLLVVTNAQNGYVVQVYGTTMTSGNNIINAMSSSASSRPGTSQFGINLRANTIPSIGNDPTGPGIGQPVGAYNIPNQYKFVSNDVIASSSEPDNYRKYTVSYIVNVNSSQAPGVYVSTLTYVCAGSF